MRFVLSVSGSTGGRLSTDATSFDSSADLKNPQLLRRTGVQPRTPDLANPSTNFLVGYLIRPGLDSTFNVTSTILHSRGRTPKKLVPLKNSYPYNSLKEF